MSSACFAVPQLWTALTRYSAKMHLVDVHATKPFSLSMQCGDRIYLAPHLPHELNPLKFDRLLARSCFKLAGYTVC